MKRCSNCYEFTDFIEAFKHINEIDIVVMYRCSNCGTINYFLLDTDGDIRIQRIGIEIYER